MAKLSINLKNCFGIKSMYEELSFIYPNNVNVIYAKNGLMKTSFAKVFNKIQFDKTNEIKDEIFGKEPVLYDITLDGVEISKEEIFVINSFESYYESSSIASLLINDDIKKRLENVLDIRENFFKQIEKMSGLKISKIALSKTIFEIENQIIKDFGFNEKSFLQNLHKLELSFESEIYSSINYSDIFDSTVIKKIESPDFQNKISEYLSKSDEIYLEFGFFNKGQFTLPKLKEIHKRLKSNSFFVKQNKIVLNGGEEFSDENDLNTKIKAIEFKLQSTKEFKAIEKLLSDAKGIILKDIIEKQPNIIEELTIGKIPELKRKIWLSYFKSEEGLFNELKSKYLDLKVDIDSLDINKTCWKETIDKFNNRFTLPFKMDIENLTSSIIGESIPKVVFSFCDKINIGDCKDSEWIKLNRDELESNNTLSQGEKRALYLLNIIFDVEKRKNEGLKTLFIIDDIADSFDYKNKYAIIEYLSDISKIDYFNLIILSHNFDFYRSISSRLTLERENKFHVFDDGDDIKLKQELYQKQPFNVWKNNLSSNTDYNEIQVKKHIISLIPFVRNLVEYGVDKKINNYEHEMKDYLFLTNLLHLKNSTKKISFNYLKVVFNEYIGTTLFDSSIKDDDIVYNLIIDIADNHIKSTDIDLENKIIYAIAIRLKAEEFMISCISSSLLSFKWKNKKVEMTGNANEFLDFVSIKKNQTKNLILGFSQIGKSKDIITVLESVNVITPESIHINSFMYEPILDMDISELSSLYHDVKKLSCT